MNIAVVDPSRVVLKIVVAALESAGHDVVAFPDAAVALERLKAPPLIDVLITSLQPHGMSGLQLVAEARAIAGQRRALHILVMSSSSERSTLVSALDGGADDFIGKPPEPEELLARLRAAQRVNGLQRDLIRIATIDALTGALNRRAFFETAALYERSDTDAVAIFDIDRFKQVNDGFGHAAGDMAIAAVAGAASRLCPTVGRLGGEEFGLLIPGGLVQSAVEMCERIRLDVAAIDFGHIAAGLRVTCSFGAGQWRRGESVDEALKRADVALYAAKSSGRNRVVAATAPADGSVMVGALGSGRRRAAVAVAVD